VPQGAKGGHGQGYDVSEHHAALELSASVGISEAARSLGLHRSAIYRWIQKYPQLWSDLRANDPNAGRRGMAQRLEDLADRYRSNEHDLLDKIEAGELAPKDAKEAAALLKAMGSSRQTATVGARQITGEPEHHELTINFAGIEQAMERLLGQAPEPAAIEGTAEDG
jgi:transposase-like protein